MRKIEILADLRVRFPERDAEFDEGVEVGIVATLMALGERNIRRRISAGSVIQLRPLAEHFRYRLSAEPGHDGVEVTLEPTYLRPSLRVVG